MDRRGLTEMGDRGWAGRKGYVADWDGLAKGKMGDGEGLVEGLAIEVRWLKVELSRALVECKAANLRAEELENAFMELVKEDNRRFLSAKEKYEDAISSLADMEKRTVMAESMLEATLQYQALDHNAPPPPSKRNDITGASGEVSRWSWPRLSPRSADLTSSSIGAKVSEGDVTNNLPKGRSSEVAVLETPKQGLLSRRFSLGWRDKSKERNGALETENELSPSVQVPEK
ncbi:hypothetical protein L7F22_067542 [Adiantum nelumboides]|nr:hypothetical protein [Adiantum nelumboides]